MKQGINLFKQGNNLNEINFKTEIVEFIIKVPILYIEFLKLFYDINKNRIDFNINRIKDKEIMKPLQIVYHGNLEMSEFITLDCFFNPDNVNPFIDNYGVKYLAIASSEDSGRGGILVGVDIENCDKIYKYRWEESDMQPDETQVLGENIFVFIKELKSLEMWEVEYDREKLCKKYNNSYYQIC